MIPHPEDTIVALASAPGPGARAIIRLSGPLSRPVVESIFQSDQPSNQRLRTGRIDLPQTPLQIPADLYFWPQPRTYTGQDVAELHLISCPPIVDALIKTLLNAGARSAQPGEFTMRAFLAGKKDLPQAEAVLAVIDAGSRDELKQALGQLAGGVTQPLQGLREDLLNMLADVEAGLDFVEEDIEFVENRDMLLRIGKGLAQLMLLQKQMQERSISHRPFRVALVGEPNAGKSRLFNALAGKPAAIVSPVAGTTRDYLTRSITLSGTSIELIDTAGWQEATNTIEEQAQQLGQNQAQSADLLLWCIEENKPIPETIPNHTNGVPVQRIWTKCDRGNPSQDPLATSAETGFGLEALKRVLTQQAQRLSRPALAPSLSRCQHHVDACLDHLRKAHSLVLMNDPAELLALELRLALDHLGEMVGAIYTDDLLDRIFSRFCIGK